MNMINRVFQKKEKKKFAKNKMSFLIDWLWSLLYEWGFFQKKATILLVGLDNAGKTSLL